MNAITAEYSDIASSFQIATSVEGNAINAVKVSWCTVVCVRARAHTRARACVCVCVCVPSVPVCVRVIVRVN